MPKYSKDTLTAQRRRKILQFSGVRRIIDANINRTKEGLRVLEEISRFILNSRSLTFKFKKLRHKLDAIFKCLPKNITLVKARDSLKDIGKNIYINELKRRGYEDIFFANMQRLKESLRVLEEFSKLKNVNLAIEFKKIRYGLYEIEKKAIRKILSLSHHR